MIESRHQPLWQEIAAMHVADCLVWQVPDHLGPHAICAAISRYVKTYQPGWIVRTNVHGGRAFILRLA